jgi:hypothetical protein
VFASKFEGVTMLARHSLSQAVRRIVADNELAAFTPHDLRRMGATLAQAARLPVDFVKALLNHNDKGVTAIYARWHMFEEKREAVMAIEAAVLPLMPQPNTPAAYFAEAACSAGLPKTLRQPSLRLARCLRMQAVIRCTFGISDPQSRRTSPVQSRR